MKEAILRGLFGTVWCYPMFALLYWLEDKKLVMIYPLETAIILTAWMMVGWIIYRWIGKMIWIPRFCRRGISPGYLSRRRRIAPKIIQGFRARGARWN